MADRCWLTESHHAALAASPNSSLQTTADLAEMHCPLCTDDLGFLSINEFLQAADGPPNIFAAGDVATSTVHPRPKAGVFAVRQGPPLADNIRR